MIITTTHIHFPKNCGDCAAEAEEVAATLMDAPRGALCIPARSRSALWHCIA